MVKMVTRKSAKCKGRSEERERLEDIQKFLELSNEDIQQVAASVPGTDIKQISKKAFEIFPYSIEVKRQEKLSIPQWWEQTVNNCQENTRPALVFRQSHKQPLVILEWYHFLELIRELNIKSKPKNKNQSDNLLSVLESLNLIRHDIIKHMVGK